VAALGVALSGCTATKDIEVQTAAVAPVPAVVPAVPSPPPEVQPGPWRIRKTEWSDADEAGFGEFVREIAESGCTTTVSCIESAANPYRSSDPPTFVLQADCAKWAYMLRAYYASKNGLPFSYVSKISSDSTDDPRFSTTSNRVAERRDIVDTGLGIDAPSVLQRLHDEVFSATYRMDPALQSPLPQDFYSPKIQPGSIRPGTAIYDINGHVMIVYDVTSDGSVLYMDANPDKSVSRGAFGPQIPKTQAALGGGFKNFRPLKLEGATSLPDGTYVGGQMVFASNEAIPDYSLEQYEGNAADAKGGDPNKQFRYNNASLNFYEYVRAAMSKGSFAYNPVYELQVSMGSLCQDANDKSPEARARVQQGFATLYNDLSKAVALWNERDLRVVYHGLSLKETLAQTYAAQEQACISAAGGDAGTNPLDRFAHRSPDSDVQSLIARIEERGSFAQMQPVGH
jgi:hypothetical protein